ncbi:uncharacterized protein Fot_38325 [Forsythia ovata]|uniref:Uncharacterized protein n=1 Tax=Forsythia ovata TaxID=205694 RepID=A0ABD1S1H2_9LAMI
MLQMCGKHIECSIKWCYSQGGLEQFQHWIYAGKAPKPGSIQAIIPLIIYRYLWMERNNSNYSEVKMKARREIKRTEHLVKTSGNSGLLLQIKLKYTKAPSVVYWQKPIVGAVKMNADTCLKRTTNLAAGGGVIRDREGKLLFGFYE